jgi:hypothetical protein
MYLQGLLRIRTALSVTKNEGSWALRLPIRVSKNRSLRCMASSTNTDGAVDAPSNDSPQTGSSLHQNTSVGPSRPFSAPNAAIFNHFVPMRTHQFDTFKFVSALEKAGYTHNQAVALMKCLRAVLVNGTDFAKSHYLSRGDLENVPHRVLKVAKL